MTKKPPERAPEVAPMVPLLVLCLGIGLGGLALFQWMELLLLEAGASTVCGLSATVSCDAVWTSPFAKATHRLFRMPIAGLGLVYGLAVIGVGLQLTHRALAGGPLWAPATATRLLAVVGAVSTVVFAGASLAVGAVCLTCLGTYLLVLFLNVVAFRLLPGPALPDARALRKALPSAALCLVGAFVLVLPAGLASPTPKEASGSLGGLATAEGQGATPGAPAGSGAGAHEQSLASFLAELPPPEKLLVSRAVEAYRRETAPVESLPPARFQYGPEGAPLRMLEWTDIRCGHCRALAEAMKQVKRVAPEGSLSVEARHFPLDATCNPAVERKGPGISCLAAQAQICLEGAPDFWQLRDRLFEQQTELTPEKILAIASSGSVPRESLMRCIESPQTAQKLREDIELAVRFGLQGTPLVVLNGKRSLPVPSFLYAMAVTRGNAESKVFAGLPPPPPHDPHDDHAGHGH